MYERYTYYQVFKLLKLELDNHIMQKQYAWVVERKLTFFNALFKNSFENEVIALSVTICLLEGRGLEKSVGFLINKILTVWGRVLNRGDF